MAGDYSRFTDNPKKRYAQVLMQQGRVHLDSDWNELAAIESRRVNTQAEDTFGAVAVPRATTPDAFAVTNLVAGPPLNFNIGAGRAYVDGLLAEIFDGENATYRKQPFLNLDEPTPLADVKGPNAIIYLDVWEREVTAIEDPELLEKALGGVDTTTRLQTVWQVKLADLPQNVTPGTCGVDFKSLFPASTGRLSTRAVKPPAGTDPCILPETGGFRGVENQLYRVEIHTAGTVASQARFKWSRENASVVSEVTEVKTAAKTTLTVTRIGRDPVLRFKPGDWVEVKNDARELRGVAGVMALIETIDEAAKTISLDRALPADLHGTADPGTDEAKAHRHTRVIRWDQKDGVNAEGLLDVTASWQPLEVGVEVRFTPAPSGSFNVGDSWVFAARVADASVEALDAAPPRAITHHYACLASVTGLATPGQQVHDCRVLWPPLPEKEECACTVCVGPNDDLAAAFGKLPQGGGRICLAAGTYTVEKPVVVKNRQRIVLMGTGPATILSSPHRETVLRFEACQEVEIDHVRVESGPARTASEGAHRNGAITFVGCSDVRVVDCDLVCPDGVDAAQTCLTIEADAKTPVVNWAKVEDNRFAVGAWQTGVLLLDVERATVRGNQVVLGPQAREAAPRRTRGGQAFLVRAISRAMKDAVRREAGPGTREIRFGREGVLHVDEASPAAPLLHDLARVGPPSAAAGPEGLDRAINRFVDQAVARGRVNRLSASGRGALRAVAAGVRAVGQGIVVAGTRIGTVKVEGNVVESAVQGIHVGVSGPKTKGPDTADEVILSRNVVHALVPASYDRDRHGIFVGNVRSLHVLDTVATLKRIGTQQNPTPVEGVRIHGHLGPYVLVRHSSLRDFAVGVSVVPVGAVPKLKLWTVAQTLNTGGGKAVDAPPGVADPGTNFPP